MESFLTNPVGIVFTSILVTFLVARLFTYLVLVWKVLPKSAFLNIKGFRLHHFVYGNALILATSFYVIVLGNQTTTVIYYLYGIGLGLILDEFPHWVGDTKELNRNVPIVKSGVYAVIISLSVLLLIYFFRGNL